MNVSRIKHGIAVGTELPEKQSYGNIGRWVEETMKSQGHELSNGAGCDMPSIGVEIKTRKNESASPHTVATIHVDDIINFPYEQSLVFEKFQRQYRIHYNDSGQVVTESQVYDFTDEYIQSKVKHAYEEGRKKIIQNEADGYHPPYVRGSEYGQFEVAESGRSYRFRIPNGAMKTVERISKNKEHFKKFFE